MSTQNYENHAQRVPAFLAILALLFLTFLGSLVNLYESWGDHQRLYSASLIVTLSIGALGALMSGRIFALKAQDRAIRAEENLRHYAMTGKLLDARLTTKQIIGLRFASDAEYLDLCKKAADQNMTMDDIKKAVKNWRADHSRV